MALLVGSTQGQNAQEADSKSQISQFFLLKQVRISEKSHRALDCTSLTPCYMYNGNENSWGKNNSCLQIRQLQSSRKENHLPKSAKWNSLHSYSNSRVSVGPNFYFTSLNYPEASKTHFPQKGWLHITDVQCSACSFKWYVHFIHGQQIVKIHWSKALI